MKEGKIVQRKEFHQMRNSSANRSYGKSLIALDDKTLFRSCQTATRSFSNDAIPIEYKEKACRKSCLSRGNTVAFHRGKGNAVREGKNLREELETSDYVKSRFQLNVSSFSHPPFPPLLLPPRSRSTLRKGSHSEIRPLLRYPCPWLGIWTKRRTK